MGRDIKSFVEQQRDDGGWEQVDWPLREDSQTGPFMWLRSSELFAWLGFGSMDEVPSVVHQYGLPDDVSETVHAYFLSVGDPTDDGGYGTHWATADAVLDAAYEGIDEDELSVLAELNRARPTRIVYQLW